MIKCILNEKSDSTPYAEEILTAFIKIKLKLFIMVWETTEAKKKKIMPITQYAVMF